MYFHALVSGGFLEIFMHQKPKHSTASHPPADNSSKARHPSKVARNPLSPTPGHCDSNSRFSEANFPPHMTDARPASVSPSHLDISRVIRHGHPPATWTKCLEKRRLGESCRLAQLPNGLWLFLISDDYVEFLSCVENEKLQATCAPSQDSAVPLHHDTTSVAIIGMPRF